MESLIQRGSSDNRNQDADELLRVRLSKLESELPDRLRELIGSESQATFADRFGMSEGAVRSYLKGTSKPGTDALLAIAHATGVTIQWLLTGYGPRTLRELRMLHEAAALASADVEEFSRVPLYDVTAGAGRQRLLEDEAVLTYRMMPQVLLDEIGVDARYAALLFVRGSSMEPDVSDASMVMIDLRARQVLSDAIYVLRVDNGVLVKNVQPLPGGMLRAWSSNKDAGWEPFTWRADDETSSVQVIGQVCWGDKIFRRKPARG